jgi:putative endonuclease
MFYVYVIKNEKDVIYIGQTSNLENRLRRHNGVIKNDLKAFTHKNKSGDWKLVYTEELKTRAEAMLREKQLKSSRGREFIRSLLKK